MKKILAIILSVIMVIPSIMIFCYAESTTTLTTTVPGATYTLNIPANQEIPFGATQTNIGDFTVTDSKGFAEGKNLKVSVTYTAFTSENMVTTIPYTLTVKAKSNYNFPKKLNSGDFVIFRGQTDGTVEEGSYLGTISGPGGYSVYGDILLLNIASEDWGKAMAGEYTATITFTCEVVAEQ